MDWNTYKEVYPDRYLKPSAFDAKKHQFIEILSFLNKRRSLVILDIGGGKNGSIDLDQRKENHCYLLDPYVVGLPEDYSGVIDWNVNFIKFDVIICRGSFNYLSEQQIKLMPELLKSDGLLIFNTFSKPTTMMRSYTKNGVFAGWEETRYIRSENIIRHKLIPDDGMSIIEHDMIYYPPDKIEGLFKNRIITKESQKNSDYYIIQLK
jgi:hypothetical protein